jgi:hypothetical protein
MFFCLWLSDFAKSIFGWSLELNRKIEKRENPSPSSCGPAGRAAQPKHPSLTFSPSRGLPSPLSLPFPTRPSRASLPRARHGPAEPPPTRAPRPSRASSRAPPAAQPALARWRFWQPPPLHVGPACHCLKRPHAAHLSHLPHRDVRPRLPLSLPYGFRFPRMPVPAPPRPSPSEHRRSPSSAKGEPLPTPFFFSLSSFMARGAHLAGGDAAMVWCAPTSPRAPWSSAAQPGAARSGLAPPARPGPRRGAQVAWRGPVLRAASWRGSPCSRCGMVWPPVRMRPARAWRGLWSACPCPGMACSRVGGATPPWLSAFPCDVPPAR